ncbi:ATP-dependent Clp protease adaptor ClpS [Clostridium guangxiense]|uniref:ATP-dependent Clp protease adaptor ClpS n=1 Tax=Clostridium guangxiense TaxID=1662055 RepID=UPI001E59900E|nr:ATP-dependent Clp protease adaptor ClpS [Clostridium guangxiense]MCD2345944.1 ATP-dependent Clp protease adaptor ClpS [Clostridium guangxiense]
MSGETKLQEKTIDEIKKPRMYKVIIYNDDYTTMDFVVEVLVSIFSKNVPEAVKIMFSVHKKGSGVAGIYSYDIAATKIKQTQNMASKNGYPLKLTMKGA